MDYKKLLQLILDIAEEMIVAGAEVNRVENSIERIAKAYGCDSSRTNAFIITSNIQVTIVSPDEEIITQIRRIIRSDVNYDRLDYLNNLSRKLCKEKPSVEEGFRMLNEILSRPKHSVFIDALGQFLIAGGFAVFFGGTILDGIASGFIGVLICFITRKLSSFNANSLARIFVTSIAASVFSIILASFGLHVDKIMIGGIMLLIPGIALTNSLRDMLIGDLVTGLLKNINSLMIAFAISTGFALPLFIAGGNFVLLHSDYTQNIEIVQIIAAFIGTLGFTIFFNMKGKQIVYASIFGALTWLIYLLCFDFLEIGVFGSNLIAAIFVGAVAEILARINRAPATIFLTASAVPLIPGGALYYATFGVVNKDLEQFTSYGFTCLSVAGAIAIGFMIVAIIQKYIFIHLHNIKEKELNV